MMTMSLMQQMFDEVEEWDELFALGLVVGYDNGLLGMANGPEWYRLPLCNDEEDA